MNRRSAIVLAVAGAASVITGSAKQPASTPATCTCPRMEERDGVLIFEGEGVWLSEGFDLESGRYRVDMEFTYSDLSGYYVGIKLHTPDGRYELLMNSTGQDDQASTLAVVSESGECFIGVDAEGVNCRIGISPL